MFNFLLRHLEIIKFLTIYEAMEKEENQNNTPTDENQNLEKETEKPEESSAEENKAWHEQRWSI